MSIELHFSSRCHPSSRHPPLRPAQRSVPLSARHMKHEGAIERQYSQPWCHSGTGMRWPHAETNCVSVGARRMAVLPSQCRCDALIFKDSSMAPKLGTRTKYDVVRRLRSRNGLRLAHCLLPAAGRRLQCPKCRRRLGPWRPPSLHLNLMSHVRSRLLAALSALAIVLASLAPAACDARLAADASEVRSMLPDVPRRADRCSIGEPPAR